MFAGVATNRGIRLVSNAQTPSYFGGLVKAIPDDAREARSSDIYDHYRLFSRF